MRLLIVAVALSALCWSASAFYVPGLAPQSFPVGEKLRVFVNRLDSIETAIPYEYSHFDFCQPSEEALKESPSENLGQVVFGERIRAGPIQLSFREPQACQQICTKKYTKGNKAHKQLVDDIKVAIDELYVQHWILDNMPFVEKLKGVDQKVLGFFLGCHNGKDPRVRCGKGTPEGTYIVFNHLDIDVLYHEHDEFVGARIVGIHVQPRSIAHDAETAAANKKLDCSVKTQQTLSSASADLSLTWSYSVTYTPSAIKWASRWDPYLSLNAADVRVHWFSIIYSLVIVLFLSFMVFLVLVRTIYKDIARYNQVLDLEADEGEEEFGWKLVHGDVFRAPTQTMLLSVFAGSGVQLFVMISLSLGFACFGFLSPAARGGLMTAVVVLWVLLGLVGGFVSAHFYKMFKGERWKSNVIMTCCLVPGVIFALFFLLNLLLWSQGSSAAVPFTTILILVILWFCVSAPLNFVGAYFGFKKAVPDFPLRTNQIPRQIPDQVFYMKPIPSILTGGMLPFGAIFIQLYFIVNSIWNNLLYYVFGFLFVVFFILAIICAEVAVLLCYFQLCAEDYRWWWRSFLTAGSTAFYIFLALVVYFFVKIEVVGSASAFLFFGYASIASFIFFIVTGSVGFVACLIFVRKIYASVKID